MKKATRIKIVALALVIFTLLSVFSVGAATSSKKSAISIPNGKQAVYSLNINRANVDRVTITLGSTEVFSNYSTTLKIFGSHAQGKFGAGAYSVKIYINPTQLMTFVEVTLPDGGVVRRGTSKITEYDTISVEASKEGVVSDIELTYEDISVNEYTIVETEPAKTVYSKRFYNIVSSFSDASTDRLFAFTAVPSFVGTGTMAVRYRVKGETEWTVVDAVKTPENTEVEDEDYYKAEISGLTPNTEYEYQVGKKNTSDAGWSELYSFTTAKENFNEFSFIAIGDTQGYMWEHFKYTKVALDEAAKYVSDPAFILHTGDVVDSGYEAYQWRRYFTALGNYGTNIANFTTIGNHDTRNAKNVVTNDNLNNYFGFYFNHPDVSEDAMVMDPSVYEGLTASGKVQVNNFNETIYSYNYGNAHFIVLNTGTYANTGNETYPDDQHIFEAQRAWLEKDLEANKDAKWKIILCHEAMYNKGGLKQDRLYLTDLIESYGVDLVIQGHSHIVTRSYPMKDGKVVTKATSDVIEKGVGTVYLTIGSTTPSHSEMGNSTVEAMQNIVFHDNTQPAYTTVAIKNGKLELTIRQINGLVLDTFTIQGEDDPEEEITEAPETEAPATETPASDTLATEDLTDAITTDTTTTDESNGCGSSVGIASVAIVALLGTCTAFLTKKKEN